MDRITLDINSLVRQGWTDVLARAAADTDLRIDLRPEKALVRDQEYGLGGTVFGAGPAFRPACVNDAVLFNKVHVADLCLFLLFQGNGLDSAGRAYPAAQVALILAETT